MTNNQVRESSLLSSESSIYYYFFFLSKLLVVESGVTNLCFFFSLVPTWELRLKGICLLICRAGNDISKIEA